MQTYLLCVTWLFIGNILYERAVELYYCINTIDRDARRGRLYSDEMGGNMDLHISQRDGVPIYLQIINQVKYLIAAGQLAPDDELPPIRVLANSLLINPNTVARAYRELASAGLVYKRKGAGTFVSDEGSPLKVKERRRIIADRIDVLLVEARQMNMGIEPLIEELRRRDAALKNKEQS